MLNRAFWRLSILSLLSGAAIAPVYAQADKAYYWHIQKVENNWALFYDEDESEDLRETDSIDFPFSCRVKSGQINVSGFMNDESRLKMADKIKADGIPVAILKIGQPPLAINEFTISYSAMDGWGYSLRIDAAAPSLQAFRKTGQFEVFVENVRVGGVTRQHKNIRRLGEFIDGCQAPKAGK